MLLSLCNLSAQRKGKDYSNILRSNNIYEIDSYLRIAHPDDPKRSVLKPRLVKLLNEYIKTAHPSDQRVKDFQEKLALLRRKPSTRISFDEMNESIRQKQIAKYREESAKKPGNYVTKVYGNAGVSAPSTSAGGASSGYVNPEEAEFEMLMSVNPIEHKNNTVKILNSLFDNDPNSKESIVLIENKSKVLVTPNTGSQYLRKATTPLWLPKAIIFSQALFVVPSMHRRKPFRKR